jgi:hypothetical protein
VSDRVREVLLAACPPIEQDRAAIEAALKIYDETGTTRGGSAT